MKERNRMTMIGRESNQHEKKENHKGATESTRHLAEMF